MRKNKLLPILLVCSLLSFSNSQAQRSLDEYDSKYGKGGRYEMEVKKGGSMMDEYYDANGTLREEVIFGVQVDGQALPGVQRNYYDCEGNFIYKTITVSFKAGVVTSDKDPKPTEKVLYEERVEYKDNKIVRGQRKTSSDRWDTYEEYDTKTNAEGKATGWKNTIYIPGEKGFFQLEEPDPTPADECEGEDCENGSELFGGYSFLIGLRDGESESFPLGAHIAYTYMMTQRFGLVADGSFHTKKENELRLMRAFLMGGLQYHIMRERERRIVLPLLRIMAGAAFDKQKYSGSPGSDATGFVIAAGLGFQFPLSQFIAVSLLTDYLRVKFKEQEAENNIRISAGLKFQLSCKYKKK